MNELDDILGDLDLNPTTPTTPVAQPTQAPIAEVVPVAPIPVQEVQVITTQKEMIDVQEEFLINRDAEETKLTLDYARQIISLEMEVKAIKDDMALIKKEYKADGVSVGKVNKAISNIKMAAKLNDLDASEIEMIETVLSADVDIRTEIALLIKKAD